MSNHTNTLPATSVRKPRHHFSQQRHPHRHIRQARYFDTLRRPNPAHLSQKHQILALSARFACFNTSPRSKSAPSQPDTKSYSPSSPDSPVSILILVKSSSTSAEYEILLAIFARLAYFHTYLGQLQLHLSQNRLYYLLYCHTRLLYNIADILDTLSAISASKEYALAYFATSTRSTLQQTTIQSNLTPSQPAMTTSATLAIFDILATTSAHAANPIMQYYLISDLNSFINSRPYQATSQPSESASPSNHVLETSNRTSGNLPIAISISSTTLATCHLPYTGAGLR